MTRPWIAKFVCLLSTASTCLVQGAQTPSQIIYEQPEKDQQGIEQNLGAPGFHIGRYSQGVKGLQSAQLGTTTMRALEYVRDAGGARNLRFPSLDQAYVDSIKNGETPRTLVIADMQLKALPDLFKDSGDALVNLRTFGNFVPNAQSKLSDAGFLAGLEYAIEVLGVKDILIIGQANSNAIQGLYARLPADRLNDVQRWMKLGEEAKYTVAAHADHDASKQDLYNATERVSLALQLANLLSYPHIRQKVDNGDIGIHGWYFNQETGQLDYYDAEANTFKPL